MGSMMQAVHVIAVIAAGYAWFADTLAVDQSAIPIARIIPKIESYRGRTVRVCASQMIAASQSGQWDLVTPRVSGYHAARLRIIACAGAAPRLDGDGCISGRIARADGSTAPTAPDGERVVSSEIFDQTWFLHAECAPDR